MGTENIEEMRFEDIREGMSSSIRVTVTAEDIDSFARLTGDISPLHVDPEFARSRGFPGRVAHGALIVGYMSRLFGVHFPGKNCLLQSVKANFVAPVYEGDEIEIVARVKQTSESVQAVVASVFVENANSGDKVMRGQVQFGFSTEEQD